MAKVILIHSFRGGTGKSNVTANLATMVARAGYRVGIVDTDIQSPGIHVLFGLKEENVTYTLNDYLWDRCPIEKAAYDVTHVLQTGQTPPPKRSSINLVPSSIKISEISRILREGYDARRLNDGFLELSRSMQLDYLFIDTHPGINEETLLSIIIADLLIVILRPDRQDYQGTAVAIDVARKLDVPNMLLVVNKALTAFKFDVLKQQLQTSYKIPVAGVLPVCQEMFYLASGGIFSMRYPEHLWTQEIISISKQILQLKSRR